MSLPTKFDKSEFQIPTELALLSIARMFWKRRILIGLLWAVGIAVTVVYVRRLPSVYTTEAIVLVKNQTIPTAYVASTVNSTVADRVVYIREQILASRRLSASLDGLVPESRSLTPEELAAQVRNNISVVIDRFNPNLIHIGYKASNPNVVAVVANKMATAFIDENISVRTEEANGTLDFTQSELDAAQQKLNDLAEAEKAYKLQHNGELPSQQGELGSRLGRWQGELANNRDTINRETQMVTSYQITLEQAEAEEEVQKQSDALMAQIASDPGIGTGPRQVMQPGPNGPQLMAVPQKRSELLKQQLAELRLHYGEAYPDVKKAKAALDAALKAEEEQASQPQPAVVAATPAPSTAATPIPPPTPSTSTKSLADLNKLRQDQAQSKRAEHIESIRRNIEDLQKHIQTLTAAQAPMQQQIDLLDAKLRQLPVREQELEFLKRDQATANALYQSLTAKKTGAEMSKNLELRQKAESFQLAEPATVPGAPTSPDRQLFTGIGVGIGLIISVLFGILLEARKGQILGEWELPKAIVVLAHLPPIRIEDQKSGFLSFFRRSKAPGMAGIAMVLAAAGAAAGAAVKLYLSVRS